MSARKSIVGYADTLRAAPGETIRFMVSASRGGNYDADVVRLHHAGCVFSGDDPPNGIPNYELDVEPVASACAGTYPARHQRTSPGSYIFVPPSAVLAALESFTLEVFIWATTPTKGHQAIVGTFSPERREGFALVLDDTGAGALVLGQGREGMVCVSTGTPVPERRWVRLGASYDADAGRATVVQHPLPESPADALTFTPADSARNLDADSIVLGAGALMMAAWEANPATIEGTADIAGDHRSGYLHTAANFNGRIDSPRIANRALGLADLRAEDRVQGHRVFGDATVAAWDFSRDISDEVAVDVGPHALNGVTINMPTRAVPGVRWTGDQPSYLTQPSHYSAIHFHDDDMTDAGWEPDFEWQIPDALPSGIYAARLSYDGGGDEIPFFVTPRPGRSSARAAFLIPTATYLSYANQTQHLRPGSIAGPPPERPCENDAFLLEHPEFGLSQYDYHSDGHGVVFSSSHRPILNLKGVGVPWGFGLDTMINAFLRRCDYEFDVITDEDLHEQGKDLLSRYRVVLTGSHPEYWSSPMLNGLEGYLNGGGRLMYLGGNGFYWRIAFHAGTNGIVEVRRAEDGTRPWISEPGEYYHQFTGEYGGLWRRLGRAPNWLVGVGFTAQGIDNGFYRRTEAASDPRAAFIFEGVDGGAIGDFGIVGAASMEIDRYDRRLGSPAHALVVATSEQHSDEMLRTKEEFHMSAHHGEDAEIRSDMTFFEGPGGGAVFSVGSISWAASLGHDNYDNSVAKITRNVLDRFLDEKPFDLPVAAMRVRRS
jgi:N,N-dimethylformamidase